MKPIVLVIVVLFSSGVAISQERPFNLARENLIGRVKTVRFERIYYVEGAQPRSQVYQTIAFDERGNRTEALSYDPNGEISTRYVYTYDEQGRNTGYDEYPSRVDKSLKTARHHVFKLDDQGRIVEYFVHDSNGQVGSHFTYRYDAKGRKFEEVFRGANDGPPTRVVYTYDDAGHVLTQTIYDRDGTVSSRIVNSYDGAGHWIEWQQFTPNILKFRKVWKFYDDGRVAEEESFANYAPNELPISHAPVPGKIIYRYNDAAHSKEIAYYKPDGRLERQEVRTFDDKGNESGLTSFESSPQLINANDTFTYEYDTHGNLVRKVRSRPRPGSTQPSPQFAEIRTITYYEE